MNAIKLTDEKEPPLPLIDQSVLFQQKIMKNKQENRAEEQKMMLLTKSSMIDDEELRSNLNINNGYISDYYKKKGHLKETHVVDQDKQYNINLHQQAKHKHPPEEKFFQTKNDFAAPLKSILQVQHSNNNNLSDDDERSTIMEQNHQQRHNQIQYHEQPRGASLDEEMLFHQQHKQTSQLKINQREIFVGPHAINHKIDYNAQPLAQMGGYAQLNLLNQANDFVKNRLAKLGNNTRHLQALNNSREKTQKKLVPLRARKASEWDDQTLNMQISTIHRQLSMSPPQFQQKTPRRLPQLKITKKIQLQQIHLSNRNNSIKGQPYHIGPTPTAALLQTKSKKRALSNIKTIKKQQFIQSRYKGIYHDGNIPETIPSIINQNRNYHQNSSKTYLPQFRMPQKKYVSYHDSFSGINKKKSVDSAEISNFFSTRQNHYNDQFAETIKSTKSLKSVRSINAKQQQQIQTSKLGQTQISFRELNNGLSGNKSVKSQYEHPNDPELIRLDKEIPATIEDEIKEGFFELKQKFKDGGPSSIYISHTVLHAKHPIFKKLQVETLKEILLDSSVIYLSPSQVVYKTGAIDSVIYIVVFGRISLRTRNGAILGGKSLNIGWTLGEEILFDRNLQVRQETAIADTEACMIGISKQKLSDIQQALLAKGQQHEYFTIESIMKGNFLIKDEWRREHTEQFGFSASGVSSPRQDTLKSTN